MGIRWTDRLTAIEWKTPLNHVLVKDGWCWEVWIILADRLGERYAALKGPNKSQRDFPRPAEAIHRKQYPLPTETCPRGEMFHRYSCFSAKEQHDSLIY